MTFGKMKKALDPFTEQVTLREMLPKSKGKLRIALAGNKNLQSEYYKALAKDIDSNVRTALAMNPNLTRDVWVTLSVDPNPQVVTALLEAHPELPDIRSRRA